jgi:hypothetical protein
MLEIFAYGLVLAAIAGGVATQVLIAQPRNAAESFARGIRASRLRRVRRASEEEAEGPAWASFPRAL